MSGGEKTAIGHIQPEDCLIVSSRLKMAVEMNFNFCE